MTQRPGMRHRPPRARLCLIALAAAMLLRPDAVSAQTERDSVSDALAGHRAELQQLGNKENQQRRAIYFDPVDIESSPAGVPCDHLKATRPDVILGEGHVVLLETIEPKPRRIRFWKPPWLGAGGDIAAEAEQFARARSGGTLVKTIIVRSFSWCR